MTAVDDPASADEKLIDRPDFAKPSRGKRWGAGVLAGLLILLGAAVRVRMYLADTSFWRDEASLALNIIRRSFAGLFGPLDYNQAAPVGFLMIQKTAVTLFGGGELVLRFWPTLASVLALPCFYFLSKSVLSRRGALISLSLLALAVDPALYWIDNKQYSTDVLTAIVLLWLAVRAMRSAGVRAVIPLGIGGTLAIWFSHSAIFVLSGISVAIALKLLIDRPRGGAAQITMLIAAWAASFGANYFLCLHKVTQSQYLQHYWSDIAEAFAPMPTSVTALVWYKHRFFDLLQYPFSQQLEGLAALAFLLGVASFFRQRLELVILFVTPILAVLAASLIHQYPFDSRLLLFLLPIMILMVAAGLDFLCRGSTGAVGGLAFALLLISPLAGTVRNLIDPPPVRCDIRDSMAFIAQHRQAGDQFYLYPTAEYGFLYYQHRFGLDRVHFVVGPRAFASLGECAADLNQFTGKRLWILAEDPYNGDPVREGIFLHEQPEAMDVLDTMGPSVWREQPFNEYVACYDLSKYTGRGMAEFASP